jgi:hypothetical protein
MIDMWLDYLEIKVIDVDSEGLVLFFDGSQSLLIHFVLLNDQCLLELILSQSNLIVNLFQLSWDFINLLANSGALLSNLLIAFDQLRG